MMEKETVKTKMREIVEASFSMPSLKELILTSIEEQATRSDFMFGRFAGVHFQMFSENTQETERIAAALELMVLAGDILDDLVDQDSLETSWSKATYKKQLRIYLSMTIKK